MKLQVIMKATLIAAGAFLSTFSLSAQTQPAPAGKPKMSREEHAQKRQDERAAQLNLTPEQKAKFAETDKKYDEKMKAARADNKEDVEKIRAERVKAHKAILNKDQAAKYDQMLADKQAKRDAHHKKGDKKGGKGKKAGQTPATPTTPDGGSHNRE